MTRFKDRPVVGAMIARRRIARVIASLAFVGLYAAACDVHGVSGPGSLSSMTVAPSSQSLVINATQQFTAHGADFEGVDVPITPVWSVVSGGGSISSSGMFTAGTVPGTYTSTVMAKSGDKTATATVTVTAGALAFITIAPTPTTLLTATNRQFTAVGTDASGNVVPITPIWAVVNGGGSINGSSGIFTAGPSAGTFTSTIRATSGLVSGFATVTVTPVAAYIDLGQAALNGIMAGTAVSCTGSTSTINANVSISPGNTITGTCIITGVLHANDAVAIADQLALTTAYTIAAGKPCSASNVISGDLGGTTKPAGVYCGAALALTGILTLDGGGDPNAAFLFQSASDLIVAGNVVLINGAQAKNVYWQVGSSATLGTASHFQGNIMALTSITLVTGTTLNGRALARNGAVSAGTGSVITLP
jgi:ice-binding like protein